VNSGARSADRRGQAASVPPYRIALTPGEPAGIGPDLAIMLAQAPPPVELVVIADPDLLASRAAALGLPLTLQLWSPQPAPAAAEPGVIRCLPVPMSAPVHPGQPLAANAAYVLATLRDACQGCLEGRFDAMVTGPVHKAVINDAGIAFTGHTELLAALCGGAHPVMLMHGPELRVALATTHLALAEVSRALTRPRLERVLLTLDAGLRQWCTPGPARILVCGLNPHAGEGGHLGREEQAVIAPVIEALRARGLDLRGPVPADTAFTPAMLADADVVLAMYHDQGLPVIKHRSFEAAVNVTLGLPVLRTSVDHGTALALAGTGRARVTNLRATVHTTIRFLDHRHGAAQPR